MRHRLPPGLILASAAVVACTDDDRARSGNPLASIDSVLTVAGRRIPPAVLNRYVADNEGMTSLNGEMRCTYVPLGVDADRVFLNTLCLELVDAGDSLVTGSGRGGPIALKVVVDSTLVRVVTHETPEDGNRYRSSVRRIFPAAVADRILEPRPADDARTGLLEAYLRGDAAARLGLRP
jgi:hypothetical protein